MPDLVRITEAEPEVLTVPPLRPSSEPDLACAHKYATTRNTRVESIAGRRGTQFHRFILGDDGYISHLVAEGLSQDETWWRAALEVENCGTDARQLLEDFLPGFKINPDHVLDLERRLYLDADMNTTEDPAKAVISGQPDLVLLDADAQRARIIDLKSQFKIVDAEDSFQGRAYSLMLLQGMKFIREVEFELAFVRYGNSKRTVIYTREHIPHLKKAVLKTRQRQVELERQVISGDLEPAVSGPQCVGCSKRLLGCPIAQLNPYTQQSAEDLVRFVVWAEGATKQAREVLKDLFLHEKAAPITDGNGRQYEPAFIHRQKRKVPLAALDIVKEWEAAGNEKRSSLIESLRLGGLTTKLKAKFRLPLAEKLNEQGMIEVTDYTVFGIKISGLEQGEDENEFEE